MKPSRRPVNPCFSSGPCAKRPGWSPAALSAALVGRSHRAAVGVKRLVEVLERSRAVLGIPQDYRVGVVPASDTGAIEMAMWSLLGARGVDVLSWENFGESWVEDIAAHLKLPDIRHFAGEVDGALELAFAELGTVRPRERGVGEGLEAPAGALGAGTGREVRNCRPHAGNRVRHGLSFQIASLPLGGGVPRR